MLGINSVVVIASVLMLSATASAAHPPTAPLCKQDVADAADVILPVHLYNQTQLRSQDLALIVGIADAIWRPYHIRLVATEVPGAAVRVTLAARTAPLAGGQGPIPVAFTVFDNGHATPTMYLWLGSAERLAARRPGERDFDELPTKLQNLVLSRILGVSLAHEIGHYLLDTASHSPRGLLRATITTRQMLDPRLKDLGLDDQQIASLCDKLPALRRDDRPHVVSDERY